VSTDPTSEEIEMKHEDDAIAALKNVSLFTGLDDKTLGRIVQQTKPHTFANGESVIDEDASGRFGRLYVVVSGTAAAQVHGANVASFGPGDYFGEVALIDDGARTATVVATTDLVCHGLTYWEFRPLVQQNATIAWNLLRTLARRLRSAQEPRPS
jgi:CRP-like cAMP-binding protein